MKTILSAALLAMLLGAPTAPAQSAAEALTTPRAQTPAGSITATDSSRADAYYYFTMGHLQERQYEMTSSAELATQSIESYKQALELDPGSAVILERLAEIYAKSQHIRDAVIQAQNALKIDPDNVDAHRLLARIYVRTLGDMSAGEVQQENLAKAVEQFQAILRIEPNDTYSLLWLARLYRFQNQHAEAEKVLRRILAHDSDNGPALEQLSQLLIDQGRSQEAIELLTHAAGDTASPDVYDLLGDAYSQAKDYPKAEQAYRQAVAADPDDPGHRHGLAQALLSEDKYAEALEQFTKLSELEPGTSENFLRAAQLYRRLGEFDQAEASLARAKQLAPGSLEILYNEALLYEDEGHYDEAVKVLTDAIAGIKSQTGGEGNPSALAILYEQLGTAYRAQRNFPAALAAFEELGKLNPDAQKRARMLVIDTYRDSHDIDRAIAEAKKALDESPQALDMTVTLAMLYGEKSDTAAARQLLQGLLKGNDADQEIYLDIAQVESRGRKYADAEQSAQKAEQMAHEVAGRESAWYMLGAIFERQKKFDEAEQEFRKVLDVNPNNAPVLNYYGYMLADRGVRIEEAASLIQRALKQEPNNGAYLDSLGWAYYKQNKLVEAEEYLRKAIDREGNDPTILSHLADVYVKLGQNERAAELFERSLAEWQKALPADYEAEKVTVIEAQLKTLKRRLAQKTPAETAKPQ
ncbi:MAG: tetratricopeptide repeat protein [Candidatus Acidoferrales bacterium]|nr:tetratricopeptide repeat protein [Candidatus Acidoferrales bacterium]